MRVLVLERGARRSHAWQQEHRRPSDTDSDRTFVNLTPEKPWKFTIGFGGSSNCWWGNTPRFMPNDFRLRSAYGVGVDWPLSYDELEPYYGQAEEMMAISGPENAPYPRSRPYPQPPHNPTDPERILQAAYPGLQVAMPSARARRPVGNRPTCCAVGYCHECPVNAKFTILNSLAGPYDDPRVTLRTEATVEQVEIAGGLARGVVYRTEGREARAAGELIALGANALFNPYLLLRSGVTHPALGRRLHEQVSVSVEIDLDGVDNFQGSTSVTGAGYMLYDGTHRSERAAALVETWNVPVLRMERDRWREHLKMRFVFDDIPEDTNYVRVPAEDRGRPEVYHGGHSAYAQAGIDALPALLPALLAPLPVEAYRIQEPNATESHIQGTVVMGDDPETSFVDRDLVAHGVRNLLVLGSSAFPTASPANPTLTLSALSLRAADRLLSSQSAPTS